MADETIRINAATKQAVGEINKLSKSMKKTELNVRTTNLAFAGFLSLSIFGSVRAIAGGIKTMVDEAAKIESMAGRFETLTGSATVAKDLMKDLADFTANTPFRLEGVADSAKTLIAFGTSVSDVKPLLQDLGDISAAVGAPLKDMSLIFGQVQAAGKLTGERYLQLAERGIVLKDVLAKELGVSVSQVRGEISKGNVTFETFKKTITSLNDEGGIAAGGMARAAGTLDGKMSTLSDNIKLTASRLGSFLLPSIKAVTQAMSDMIAPPKEKTALQQAADDLFNLRDAKAAVGASNETGATGDQFGISDDAQATLKAGFQKQIDAKLEQIEKLTALEDAAAEAKKVRDAEAAEETRLQRIEDEKLREDALIAGEEARYLKQLEATKRRQKLERKYMTDSQKELSDWNKHKLTEEEQLQQKKGAIIGQGLNAIAALAKEGGKESFAIWKAAALTEATVAGYLAVQKALASAPPPWNFIAAGAVGIQTALNIRGIAQTAPPAFADGGVVGGFVGATSGADNRTITARDGEMFLNAPQQRNLFDDINSGARSTAVLDAINRLGDRIANMEVVVMTDDYEIGRSVNRAIDDGLVLGAAA